MVLLIFLLILNTNLYPIDTKNVDVIPPSYNIEIQSVDASVQTIDPTTPIKSPRKSPSNPRKGELGTDHNWHCQDGCDWEWDWSTGKWYYKGYNWEGAIQTGGRFGYWVMNQSTAEWLWRTFHGNNDYPWKHTENPSVPIGDHYCLYIFILILLLIKLTVSDEKN